MGLLKTALIAGGVLLGVGAVGGIAAGVVTRQNAESQVINPSDGNGDSSNQEGGMQNLNTVASVLKSIQPTDIVVKDQQTQKQQSDYYAFNLANKTLEISSTKTIPQGFNITITTKNNATVADLNEGKLSVRVKVEQVGTSMSQETDLDLSGFKKIDNSLKALFDKKTTGSEEEKNQTDSSYSLTLIPQKTKATNLISVEGLNQIPTTTPSIETTQQTSINGLTTWLANSEKASMAMGVQIEGKVKLTSISKAQNSPTIFELGVNKDGEQLKLVKTVDGNKLEALIGKIKTTNLLATSISVIPTSNDATESVAFKKQLLDRTNMMETEPKTGFKVEDNNLFVQVPKMPADGTTSSQVKLNSYVVKSTATEENKIAIPLGLQITFGTGIDATTFLTTNKNQAKTLEDAGFSFHFYTRLLDGKNEKTAMNLVADDVTEGTHKLETYLKTQNYTTPSAAPTLQQTAEPENAVVNNNFFVLGSLKANMQNGQSWETTMWMNDNARNYVAFADYSYTAANGENGMNVLDKKVLFTPELSLINVQKQTQTQQ